MEPVLEEEDDDDEADVAEKKKDERRSDVEELGRDVILALVQMNFLPRLR